MTRTSKEELERWMTELSNWGRWGKDDQLGTVNLITPEKRKQAARRDIALFGGDTSHEAFDVPGFPIALHTVIMVPMGMNMLDNPVPSQRRRSSCAVRRMFGTLQRKATAV
jgi:hypothetical protein